MQPVYGQSTPARLFSNVGERLRSFFVGVSHNTAQESPAGQVRLPSLSGDLLRLKSQARRQLGMDLRDIYVEAA